MKILLVCSLGMSSAIAVNSLKKACVDEGIEAEIKECSTQAFEEEVKNYDIAMIAPQIRHRFETLKKIADENNVPCALISPQGYTPIGGSKLLKQIKDELDK